MRNCSSLYAVWEGTLSRTRPRTRVSQIRMLPLNCHDTAWPLSARNTGYLSDLTIRIQNEQALLYQRRSTLLSHLSSLITEVQGKQCPYLIDLFNDVSWPTDAESSVNICLLANVATNLPFHQYTRKNKCKLRWCWMNMLTKGSEGALHLAEGWEYPTLQGRNDLAPDYCFYI